MKFKLSIALLLVGIVLTIYGSHMMYRISKAKKNIHKMNIPFSKKPIGIISGESYEEASGKYDQLATWTLVGGIVLIVIGGWMIFTYRKK